MDIDLQALQEQVQTNCHISDANFSGSFSLCGLLLRLRDLYKWASGLAPWEEPEQGMLLEWVEEREHLWQELQGRECAPVTLGGRCIPCFETDEVNELLEDTGLLYGAGYVIGMKPSFFLARPIQSEILNGLRVHTVDRELCRDIFVTPVMRQGDLIVARRQAMASLMWDVVQEQRPSVRQALDFALAGYGLDSSALLQAPASCEEAFLNMVDCELQAWVHHEVGEALEDAFPGDVWHQMVADYCQSLAEVFIRSVKDLLADTHPQGLLAYMIGKDRRSSLGLYLAMMRPFTRALFPEIWNVFPDFLQSGKWSAIEQARLQAYAKGRDLADKLITLHLAGDPLNHGRTVERITEEIIRPLGILGALGNPEPS
jgi:hypothetical protein